MGVIAIIGDAFLGGDAIEISSAPLLSSGQCPLSGSWRLTSETTSARPLSSKPRGSHIICEGDFSDGDIDNKLLEDVETSKTGSGDGPSLGWLPLIESSAIAGIGVH